MKVECERHLRRWRFFVDQYTERAYNRWMTINERAIKIAEEEIGDDVCNKIGIRATGAIIRAIERALVEDACDDNMGPVEKMELYGVKL